MGYSIMKYQTKTFTVDAYQWQSNNLNMPAWLTAAFKAGIVKANVLPAKQNNNKVQYIMLNDYIVKDNTGAIRVYANTEFNKLYEPRAMQKAIRAKAKQFAKKAAVLLQVKQSDYNDKLPPLSGHADIYEAVAIAKANPQYALWMFEAKLIQK